VYKVCTSTQSADCEQAFIVGRGPGDFMAFTLHGDFYAGLRDTLAIHDLPVQNAAVLQRDVHDRGRFPNRSRGR
jgi:hypothetical protein